MQWLFVVILENTFVDGFNHELREFQPFILIKIVLDLYLNIDDGFLSEVIFAIIVFVDEFESRVNVCFAEHSVTIPVHDFEYLRQTFPLLKGQNLADNVCVDDLLQFE